MNAYYEYNAAEWARYYQSIAQCPMFLMPLAPLSFYNPSSMNPFDDYSEQGLSDLPESEKVSIKEEESVTDVGDNSPISHSVPDSPIRDYDEDREESSIGGEKTCDASEKWEEDNDENSVLLLDLPQAPNHPTEPQAVPVNALSILTTTPWIYDFSKGKAISFKDEKEIADTDFKLQEFILALKPAPQTKPNNGAKKCKANMRHGPYKPRDKSGMKFTTFRNTIAQEWAQAVVKPMSTEKGCTMAEDRSIIEDFKTRYPKAAKFFNANSIWAIRHGFTFIQYSGIAPAQRPKPKPRTRPLKRVPNFTTEKVRYAFFPPFSSPSSTKPPLCFLIIHFIFLSPPC